MKRCLNLLLPVLVLSGCSANEKVEDKTQRLGSYESTEVILRDADALLTDMEFDDVSKLKCINGLKELLAAEEIKLRIEAKRCSGVGTWTAGGGGLIVKVSKSRGLISFAAGTKKRAFDGKSFAVGAILGGGKTYGTFLIFDLASESSITGDYTFTGAGGAFGETSGSSATLTPSREGMKHKIWAVGQGTGFGGEASIGKVSVRWLDAKQEPGEAPPKKTGDKK